MLVCRGGKAVTISHASHKGHKEKVSALVDNKLLDQRDKVVTVQPAISRHELAAEECSFVVLASAALAAALKPQQIVDIINRALKVEFSPAAAASHTVYMDVCQLHQQLGSKSVARGFEDSEITVGSSWQHSSRYDVSCCIMRTVC